MDWVCLWESCRGLVVLDMYLNTHTARSYIVGIMSYLASMSQQMLLFWLGKQKQQFWFLLLCVQQENWLIIISNYSDMILCLLLPIDTIMFVIITHKSLVISLWYYKRTSLLYLFFSVYANQISKMTTKSTILNTLLSLLFIN